jgi:hypothetical protein
MFVCIQIYCKFEPCSFHHMYNVSNQVHELYGEIVTISIEEIGSHLSPFQAANQARLLRRSILEKGAKKVKFLIENEILTIHNLENWANKEYKFLPKCFACGSILKTQVYTHPLCKNNLFCSKECSDMNYTLMNEKMLDEVEIDYL